MGKTYNEVHNAAIIFANSAKILNAAWEKGLKPNVSKSNSNVLLQNMVPAFVLMSFSCELFLKALAIKNGNTVKNVHELNDLFEIISDQDKTNISNAVINDIAKITKNKYSCSDFNNDIDNISNTFKEWRYYYENSKSLNILFLKSLFNVLINYSG